MTEQSSIESMQIIPKGKANAIRSAELQRIWQTDKRGVSARIRRLREAGSLICSGNAGYYRPETAEELQEFYRLMRAKAIGLLSVLKETRKELQRQGVDVH